MIDEFQGLQRVAETLHAALGELDLVMGDSAAAVHLQWAIDLIADQVDMLGVALLEPIQLG